MNRCAIILAGGSGTRLHPITQSINKQLLPVYDKPLIYYPLSTVIQAGVQDILLITGSKNSQVLFQHLLGDGSQFGVKLTYRVQDKPRGIADAFLVGEDFIGNRPVMLVLGDNIFHGEELVQHFQSLQGSLDNVIFGKEVADPSSYGVASIGYGNDLLAIMEKPRCPPSNWAIPGLYFYDHTVVEKAKSLRPSARKELEITDLSWKYLYRRDLSIIRLYDTVWFDCGTHDSLLDASQYVRAVQQRTGKKIGDPLVMAQCNGWK